MNLDALWAEMLLDACASDGPIRDADVREAMRRYRGRIEQAAAASERERMVAMRHDYQTMPHAQFPERWPGWREYEEVLPRTCDCRDCRLWRSGS